MAAGGRALREGRYADAASRFVEVLQWAPGLAHVVGSNLAVVRRRAAAAARAAGGPLRVGVGSWDLGHNCAGRAYALALLYRRFARVELFGSIFPSRGSSEIWLPLRESAHGLPIHSFVVHEHCEFVRQALALVCAHPYDIVHLTKPRLPNILFGLLYKLVWGASVLLDIDDEELAFVGAETPFELSTLTVSDLQAALAALDGRDATRIGVALAQCFDGLTVATSPLRSRYGGEVVPHAREPVTEPIEELRARGRERLGALSTEKIVLFIGTPRPFKGLVETGHAIAALQRPDVRYVIVGGKDDGQIERELAKIPGLQLRIVAPQPMSAATEIAAAADLCVLLQDRDSEAARMQMPAKLSDYLSVGAPVLVSDVPAMRQVIDFGAVQALQAEALPEEVANLLENDAARAQLSARGRAFFEDHLSVPANEESLERLAQVVSRQPAFAMNASLEALAKAALGEADGLLVETRPTAPTASAAFGLVRKTRVAVVLHLHHLEVWPKIAKRLRALSGDDFSLFVTTTQDREMHVAALLADQFPQAQVVNVENELNDIEPFLKLIPRLALEGYECVCKLHTIPQFDSPLDGVWCDRLLDALVGSRAIFSSVVNAFANNPEMAIAGPVEFYFRAQDFGRISRLEKIEPPACREMRAGQNYWGFFAGRMFWARTAALLALTKVIQSEAVNEACRCRANSYSDDAIERIFGLLPSTIEGGRVGLLFSASGFLRVLRIIPADRAANAALRADVAHVAHQFQRLPEECELLSAGSLFDEAHYRSQRPELPASADAVVDYLTVGRFFWTTPNRAFQRANYLDLISSKTDGGGRDAFVDFIVRGCEEPRVAHACTSPPEATLRRQALNERRINWRALEQMDREPGTVSIIIPVYGQLALTEASVGSVIKNTRLDGLEIILVDNGSDAETRNGLRDIARRNPSVLQLLRLEENTGFALGSNLGFAQCIGSICVFLNNDTQVTEGWLESLLKPLIGEDAPIVQPALLYPDGTIQCMGVVFINRKPIGRCLHQGRKPEEIGRDDTKKFQAVSAACMALSAKDFARLRGFDPIFTNGQEDIDLCFRLTSIKHQEARVVEQSIVYHYEGRSKGRYDYVKSNREAFIKKNLWRIRWDD
jgi:GT2 family glycosyltransferase/glycosyltransferase involved in cell wall biosynthesis